MRRRHMRRVWCATLALVVWGTTSAGAQDCSVPRGALPVPVVMPTGVLTAALAATRLIAPVRGRLGVVITGYSNIAGLASPLDNLLRRTDDVAAGHVLVRAAVSGKTTEYWANPADSAWSTARARVAEAGLAPDQVVAVIAGFGSRKQEATPIADWQFEAQAQEIARQWPNVRLVTWISMNGTPGPTPNAAHLYTTAPVNMATVAAMVEDPSRWPAQQAHLLLDLWADGTAPNPWTASPRYPEGLSWRPEDYATDCVHQSPIGANRAAWSLYDRLRESPVYRPWLFR